MPLATLSSSSAQDTDPTQTTEASYQQQQAEQRELTEEQSDSTLLLRRQPPTCHRTSHAARDSCCPTCTTRASDYRRSLDTLTPHSHIDQPTRHQRHLYSVTLLYPTAIVGLSSALLYLPLSSSRSALPLQPLLSPLLSLRPCMDCASSFSSPLSSTSARSSGVLRLNLIQTASLVALATSPHSLDAYHLLPRHSS